MLYASVYIYIPIYICTCIYIYMHTSCSARVGEKDETIGAVGVYVSALTVCVNLWLAVNICILELYTFVLCVCVLVI